VGLPVGDDLRVQLIAPLFSRRLLAVISMPADGAPSGGGLVFELPLR
jgi:hypothetical protein